MCTYFPEENEEINCVDFLENLYNKLNCRYVVGQLEKCPKTGNLHYQFYVDFYKSQRISRFKKISKRIHADEVHINNGADKYCFKEKTRVLGPFEFGCKPILLNKKTNDYKEIIKLAEENNLEEIKQKYPTIYLNRLNQIRQIAKDNLIQTHKDHLRGIWIYGESGLGKSKWVRINCKDLYNKDISNNWDGYKGQQFVVIDDLDPESSECLKRRLKIWTDSYGCNLNVKCSYTTNQYDWLIVTSQYRLYECFSNRTFDALNRRFIEINISDILDKDFNYVKENYLKDMYFKTPIIN